MAEVAMGLALIAGTVLARARRYAAHGICQAVVLLLNLVMIAYVMGPSFHDDILPVLPKHLTESYYGAATVHGILGICAEVFGLFILLVAGTEILPRRLRFQHFKLWMRVELGLWWVVIVSGVVTYFAWYVRAP